MVPPDVMLDVRRHLAALEAEEGLRVLFAVESGSRAWGFASTDSDYDVRLVYVRRPEWYLSINLESKPDVIGRQLPGDIDLSGWDVRKALKLFAKSNPALNEWLDSPVVYRDDGRFAGELRALLPAFFSPAAGLHHYLRMARGNFQAYLQGPTVLLKKYLYVLRPVLAAHWIERGRGPVPMPFDALLTTLDAGTALRGEIDTLLARKSSGEELDEGPRLPAVHDFVSAEMDRLEAAVADAPKPQLDVGLLDDLFRRTLGVAA